MPLDKRKRKGWRGIGVGSSESCTSARGALPPPAERLAARRNSVMPRVRHAVLSTVIIVMVLWLAHDMFLEYAPLHKARMERVQLLKEARDRKVASAMVPKFIPWVGEDVTAKVSAQRQRKETLDLLKTLDLANRHERFWKIMMIRIRGWLRYRSRGWNLRTVRG